MSKKVKPMPTSPPDIMEKRENTVGTTAWNYLYWAVTPAHTDTGLLALERGQNHIVDHMRGHRNSMALRVSTS